MTRKKSKTDFGEANGLVEAVRQQTPNDASILIQTQQPLKYLLNYELYPRHFYFHPNPNLNASEIPSHWMNDHHIGWILYIADDEPLHFAAVKTQGYGMMMVRAFFPLLVFYLVGILLLWVTFKQGGLDSSQALAWDLGVVRECWALVSFTWHIGGSRLI